MTDPTTTNINYVRHQISRKLNYNIPYYASRDITSNIITDMDHFPYKRYFRGVYHEQSPVIMEREAGFRPRNDSCYTQISIPNPSNPDYCWEYPCSTVKPCKVKENKNKDKLQCSNNFVVAP